jgi:hypothetical protein
LGRVATIAVWALNPVRATHDGLRHHPSVTVPGGPAIGYKHSVGIRRGLGLKLGMLIDRVSVLLSYSKRCDGLWIGVSSGRSDAHHICRVEASLGLIKRHDPRRYARIRRDIEQIWIVPLYGVAGKFAGRFPHRCYLDYSFVASSSREAIAATVIHEATHAQLWRRGVGISEELRYRVERICMQEELSFARRLPDGRELSESIERDMALASAPWSKEVLQQQRLEQWRADLRRVGVPDWLVRLALALHRLPQAQVRRP